MSYRLNNIAPFRVLCSFWREYPNSDILSCVVPLTPLKQPIADSNARPALMVPQYPSPRLEIANYIN
jgi:hypothetical protein